MAANIPYEVIVWVYDLSNGMAKAMSPMFLGRQIEAIYHTGVVVYGTEYFFGGGIAADRPGSTQAGAPIRKVKLGTTTKTQDEFHAWLQTVGDKYTMQTYNILSHNCNNFAADCCNFLLSEQPQSAKFPQEILDLPSIVLATPMGQMFKPMLEAMGPNSQNQGGQSFIPQAQQHLSLPTSIHNNPPRASGTTTTTTTTTASTAVNTGELVSSSTKIIKKKFPFDHHRITSLTEEVSYHALNDVPCSFPTVNHAKEQITKMFLLVKASYKNPTLAAHFMKPSVIAAQTTLADVVNRIVEYMSRSPASPMSPVPLSVNEDTNSLQLKRVPISAYVDALSALQLISDGYDSSAIVGNLGLYNILVCQLLLETILSSQESIESSHEIDNADSLHAVCKKMYMSTIDNNDKDKSTTSSEQDNNDNNDTQITFDTFITKIISKYQTDIIQTLVPDSTTKDNSTVKLNPAVSKIVRSNMEQLFHFVLQLGITQESQHSVITLATTILDNYWGDVMTMADENGVIGGENDVLKNKKALLSVALSLLNCYLTTIKTDHTTRPPSFLPALPIRTGIDNNNSNKFVLEGKNQELNQKLDDLLTDFYTTSILKLQELFSSTQSVQLSADSNVQTQVNINLIANLDLAMLLLFTVVYIANGTKQHCLLLTALDFEVYETAHQWHNLLLNSYVYCTENKTKTKDVVVPDEKTIKRFVSLLEDFDGVMIIGNRERPF